jgi:hypothetical protein
MYLSVIGSFGTDYFVIGTQFTAKELIGIGIVLVSVLIQGFTIFFGASSKGK